MPTTARVLSVPCTWKLEIGLFWVPARQDTWKKRAKSQRASLFSGQIQHHGVDCSVLGRCLKSRRSDRLVTSSFLVHRDHGVLFEVAVLEQSPLLPGDKVYGFMAPACWFHPLSARELTYHVERMSDTIWSVYYGYLER